VIVFIISLRIFAEMLCALNIVTCVKCCFRMLCYCFL